MRSPTAPHPVQVVQPFKTHLLFHETLQDTHKKTPIPHHWGTLGASLVGCGLPEVHVLNIHQEDLLYLFGFPRTVDRPAI